MTPLSKRERVDAVLRGEVPDRAPVSAWRHFIPEERTASSLAAASLEHFQSFDWDWLKVNPRATYYAEAWGNRYDLSHYTGVLPLLLDGPVRAASDLARIAPLHPTDGVFGEQLELLRRIKHDIGDAHLVQTVFSPLSVLAFLSTELGDQTGDLGLQSNFERLRGFLAAQPDAAHAALDAIATTLASYAAASVEAGASGLFFAIVRLARQGVLSEAEYASFGRPYDLRVLEAVRGASFNLLHICGPNVYFDAVLDYPVHALNWTAVGQGNPTLAEAQARTSKALIGGVDEHGALRHGTPAAVLDEARAALNLSGGRLLLSPGCGIDAEVPEANLHALRQAAEA